jgi:uncharacterized surface protein with fasciclin (FAS1) repeats
MKNLIFLGVALFLVFAASLAFAQERGVVVGGTRMYPSRNIIENTMNSRDHETWMTALKTSYLVETLYHKGPFTVFAPTDAAFEKLAADSVTALLRPENRRLFDIVSYHIISGSWSFQDLSENIKEGGGTGLLTTASGHKLTLRRKGRRIGITDESNSTSWIEIPDVFQSNGIIHVVDSVLMPQ